MIIFQTPTYSHSRTGSSPAMMQASPPGTQTLPPSSVHSSPSGGGGAKAARTHTYPKIPEKFKVRNEQPPPTDEEVIYF